MISQSSIDAIFQATQIAVVIEDYVKLTKRGVNYKGLCPFHDEKTPSFTVSPTRNIYKCFGCGRGGNAVNFLMEHEGLSYPEALRLLAQKFNISIEETQLPENYQIEKQERDSLYLVNAFAGDFYKNQLFNSDMGKSVGLSYFKKRGFIQKTLESFDLGYASADRDSLTKAATSAGYKIEFLRKLGLTNKHDRDFFFNRVIFPIHNLSGKIVAFAGRQLTEEKKSPKYVNSKESDIYHKSKVLYGLHLAKQAIRKEDYCLMVEGYTDVLSLHQSGVHNVVASSGTALTVDQIRLVKRYTKQIKILFDGDPAGIKAAMRGIDLVLAQDMNVKLVLLPPGEDPDSYITKVGVSAFKDFLDDQARDFILFKTNLLLKEAGDDPVKKSNLIRDIIDSLAHIPNTITRSVYTRQCAELLNVEEHLIVSETNKVMSKRMRDERINRFREAKTDHEVFRERTDQDLRKAPGTTQQTNVDLSDEYQEKDIIRILILFGHRMIEAEHGTNYTIAQFVLSNIQEVIPEFDNQLYRKIATEYGLTLADGKELTTDHFINHSDPEIAKLATEFCASPYDYSENWAKMYDIKLETQPMPDDNQIQDSIQAVYRLQLRKYKKMSDENLKQIKIFQENDDQDSLLKHLSVQKMLVEKRNEIADKLNTVIL